MLVRLHIDDHRLDLRLRSSYGLESLLTAPARPLVTIVGQVGFAYFEKTLYVRILCPYKGRKPIKRSRR